MNSRHPTRPDPALEAICAVREPLERRDLTLLLERSEYEIWQLTARFGSLFPTVDGQVHPFHQSVRDWLIYPNRSGSYWIDVSAQNSGLPISRGASIRLALIQWGDTGLIMRLTISPPVSGTQSWRKYCLIPNGS